MFCLLHGNQSPPNSRPGHPDHGLNRGMKAENQSSPQQAHQSRSHRPRHHRETAEYQGTHRHLKTSHRHTCLAATRTCGPNPKLRAENQSSPHRHRATNHSTTTKPRNTNNLINTQRTATGTPATQPTKSADRTANHTTTSEPVHTDAHQHRATNHDTTTKPRNTNNPHTPR